MKSTKEIILEESIKLFARKGYNGAGIRSIAREAGVNTAQISYYFGSKSGILKSIIDLYFDNVKSILTEVWEAGFEPKTRIKEIIFRFIDFFRENTDMAKIAIYEMPYDLDEITDFKLQKQREIRDFLENSFLVKKEELMTLVDNKEFVKYHKYIMGPGFMSLIFSTFLFAPMLSREIELDDEFYKNYKEIVLELVLSGYRGIIKKYGGEINE